MLLVIFKILASHSPLLLNKEKVHYNSMLNTILFIVTLYIGFSILNADNINEGIISAYKILITISVFFLSIIAFKKIESPVLFLAQLLSFFLLLESLYLIIDYNISRSFIKGIAQNPNISSSSILFKLIFLNNLYFVTLAHDIFFHPMLCQLSDLI